MSTPQAFDSLIRSSVDLARLEEGVQKQVRELLRKTQQSIIDDINHIDPTKPKLTKFKQQRLAQLRNKLGETVREGMKEIRATTKKGLVGVAKYEAQNAKRIFDTAIGADITEIHITPRELQSLVSNTLVQGDLIGKWWNKQTRKFRENLETQMNAAMEQIQIGTVRGETIGELVRRVRGTRTTPGVMNIAKRDAEALVRTSYMTVANEARMATYRANEDIIKYFQVVATLDARTTMLCRSLDGLLYDKNFQPVGHKQIYPGGPPFHWMCRTVLLPVTYSWSELSGPNSTISKTKLKRLDKALTSSQRAALGKPVKEGTNYNQWLKRQPARIQVEVLGKRRRELWKKYNLTQQQLVTQKGRQLTIPQLEARYDTEAFTDAAKVLDFPSAKSYALHLGQQGTPFDEFVDLLHKNAWPDKTRDWALKRAKSYEKWLKSEHGITLGKRAVIPPVKPAVPTPPKPVAKPTPKPKPTTTKKPKASAEAERLNEVIKQYEKGGLSTTEIDTLLDDILKQTKFKKSASDYLIGDWKISKVGKNWVAENTYDTGKSIRRTFKKLRDVKKAVVRKLMDDGEIRYYIKGLKVKPPTAKPKPTPKPKPVTKPKAPPKPKPEEPPTPPKPKPEKPPKAKKETHQAFTKRLLEEGKTYDEFLEEFAKRFPDKDADWIAKRARSYIKKAEAETGLTFQGKPTGPTPRKPRKKPTPKPAEPPTPTPTPTPTPAPVADDFPTPIHVGKQPKPGKYYESADEFFNSFGPEHQSALRRAYKPGEFSRNLQYEIADIKRYDPSLGNALEQNLAKIAKGETVKFTKKEANELWDILRKDVDLNEYFYSHHIARFLPEYRVMDNLNDAQDFIEGMLRYTFQGSRGARPNVDFSDFGFTISQGGVRAKEAMEIINEVTREVHRLLVKYRSRMNSLISSRYMSSGTYASVSGGKGMSLNYDWVSDMKKLKSSFQHGIQGRYHPGIAGNDEFRYLQALISHEFGHTTISSSAYHWKWPRLEKIWKQHRKELRQIGPQNMRADFISNYAKKNPAEMGAETFAAIERGPARYARGKYYQEIKEYYDQHWRRDYTRWMSESEIKKFTKLGKKPAVPEPQKFDIAASRVPPGGDVTDAAKVLEYKSAKDYAIALAEEGKAFDEFVELLHKNAWADKTKAWAVKRAKSYEKWLKTEKGLSLGGKPVAPTPVKPTIAPKKEKWNLKKEGSTRTYTKEVDGYKLEVVDHGSKAQTATMEAYVSKGGDLVGSTQLLKYEGATIKEMQKWADDFVEKVKVRETKVKVPPGEKVDVDLLSKAGYKTEAEAVDAVFDEYLSGLRPDDVYEYFIPRADYRDLLWSGKHYDWPNDRLKWLIKNDDKLAKKYYWDADKKAVFPKKLPKGVLKEKLPIEKPIEKPPTPKPNVSQKRIKPIPAPKPTTTGTVKNFKTGGGLTNNEIAAFDTYTVGEFESINAYGRGTLRLGMETAEGNFITAQDVEEIVDIVKDLDNALSKMVKSNKKELYRGMNFNSTSEVKTALSKMKPGGIIQDGGFMSTSKSYDMAEEFMLESNSIMMRVKNPKTGVDLEKLGGDFVGEKEVLFPRNARFKVSEIKEIKTNYGTNYEVIVEEI